MKKMNEAEMALVLDTLLHRGITKYRKHTSKAPLPERVQEENLEQRSRKGAIFVVRQKEDFTAQGVKGYVVTSKETLLEDAHSLSHFTPNVYRVSGYTDKARRYICGFEERNLQQINTFVVDIDTKKYKVNELLLACLDDSIGLPTLIVESARGYQLYFALESPVFISNKNNFQSLTVAKRVADNLKRSLHAVEADLFCNDFGFFRLPKADNIVYCDLENIYCMKELMNWSMRCDDDLARPLFVELTKKTKAIITQADWFVALVHTTNIKGKKGQIGRNNTLFTLALIGYAEGWSMERTANFLDEFNTRLEYPLKGQELNSLLQSAYSGKYNGPSKEYVEALLELYVPNGHQFSVSFGQTTWYKFKKERKDRKRSHYDEREQDLIDYITAEKEASAPFLWRTQKEMCEAVGMAPSTLNEVLKRSKKLLKTVTGAGRAKKTGWTTVALFMQTAMETLKATKAQYYVQLSETLQADFNQLDAIAGYETLQVNLARLFAALSPPDDLEKMLKNSS